MKTYRWIGIAALSAMAAVVPVSMAMAKPPFPVPPDGPPPVGPRATTTTSSTTTTTTLPPAVDLCPNLTGIQATVPEGMVRDANGNCVTDLCPNLAGIQLSVPEGMVRDAQGNCVPSLTYSVEFSPGDQYFGPCDSLNITNTGTGAVWVERTDAPGSPTTGQGGQRIPPGETRYDWWYTPYGGQNRGTSTYVTVYEYVPFLPDPTTAPVVSEQLVVRSELCGPKEPVVYALSSFVNEPCTTVTFANTGNGTMQVRYPDGSSSTLRAGDSLTYEWADPIPQFSVYASEAGTYNGFPVTPGALISSPVTARFTYGTVNPNCTV
jgi:hypothetical protein